MPSHLQPQNALPAPKGIAPLGLHHAGGDSPATLFMPQSASIWCGGRQGTSEGKIQPTGSTGTKG